MTPSLTLHIHCTHVYEATAGCKVAIDYDTSRRGVRGFVASMGNNAGHDLLNWDVWPFLVGSDHPSPSSMVVWCTKKKRRKWHDRLNLQRPPHQTQSHSSRNLWKNWLKVRKLNKIQLTLPSHNSNVYTGTAGQLSKFQIYWKSCWLTTRTNLPIKLKVTLHTKFFYMLPAQKKKTAK